MSVVESPSSFNWSPGTIVEMSAEDFLRLVPGKVRAEWVAGRVEVMSPANFQHSRLVVFIASFLCEYVRAHDLGEVAGEPGGIRLSESNSIRLPDVFFVAKERLDLVGSVLFEGAPDLAVEVVSPESQSRDRHAKFQEYELSGVREYWIIDPYSRTFEAYKLNDAGKFAGEIIKTEFASAVLPGLIVKEAWFWLRTFPSPHSLVANMQPPKPGTP